MPHLILDYSSNLADAASLTGLCRKLADVLDAQRENDKAVFPRGGIRVRAIPCKSYGIADGSIADAAYLHANLKIGAGRSEAAKKAAGDALFETIKDHFAHVYATQGLALSMEINEFAEAGTWKHNNLHGLLKKD